MSENLAITHLFKHSQTSPTTDVKIPGKLFISGEYAILFPQQPAILIAVDQYLHARITSSPNLSTGEIQSNLAELGKLSFTLSQEGFVFSPERSSGWTYVIHAMIVVSELFKALNIPLKAFNLSFHSDLVHDNGVKLGLGSSGAVVVGTIKSLLDYNGLTAVDNSVIFKLAAIALTRLQSKGSLGDIATITHGGWVYYQAFDRQWLNTLIQQGVSVAELLLLDWPDLIIENLEVSSDLSLLIGWTQAAASTENLVSKLLSQITDNDAFLANFLLESKVAVNRLQEALVANQIDQVQLAIQNYRRLLQALEQHYHLNIETNKLSQLIQTANNLGFASKSSGAGGGDCGIAIASNNHPIQQLEDKWQQLGIVTLDLNPTTQF